MRAISVHVDEVNYQRFKTLASLAKRPLAALIRAAMSDYLEREERPGRSVLELPAHRSGRPLRGWTRGELYDEMLDGRA